MPEPQSTSRMSYAEAQLGWKEGLHILMAKPASYGVTVEAEPGFGFRVRMLTLDSIDSDDPFALQHLWHRVLCIDKDGRIGLRETKCIEGAGPEGSQPPGAPQTMPVSQAVYRRTLRSLKLKLALQVLPDFVAPAGYLR